MKWIKKTFSTENVFIKTNTGKSKNAPKLKFIKNIAMLVCQIWNFHKEKVGFWDKSKKVIFRI
jgi:hypothetical protein